MKRHFFITGTSKGIGKALALQLLKDSETLVTGISRSSSIQDPCYRHISVDLLETERLIESVEEIFQVDDHFEVVGLINNAGSLGEIGYFGEINTRNYGEVVSVNTIAPAILVNEFIRRFDNVAVKKLILNISSGAGIRSYDGWGGYCSSKAALNMLTKVIAKEQEIRRSGIRVFAVEPGIVATNMQDTVRKTDIKQFSKIQKFIDLKEKDQLLTPQESAERLARIINHPEQYKDVILDVREF